MSVTLTGASLPLWLQLVVAGVAVLGFLGGAAAFLFVIWPSIRSGERRASRIERWVDSAEGEVAIRRLKELLSRNPVGGSPQSRDAFLSEDTGAEEQKGRI